MDSLDGTDSLDEKSPKTPKAEQHQQSNSDIIPLTVNAPYNNKTSDTDAVDSRNPDDNYSSSNNSNAVQQYDISANTGDIQNDEPMSDDEQMVIAEETELSESNKIDLQCPEKPTYSDIEDTNCDTTDNDSQKLKVNFRFV